MDKHKIVYVDYMTDYLIENYPEFKNKKRKPFKQSVQKGMFVDIFGLLNYIFFVILSKTLLFRN